jgi:hypothetical protein
VICCLLALLALLPGFAAVKANRGCHARRQLRLTGIAVVFAAFLFGAAVVAHAGGQTADAPSMFAPICGLLGHAHAAALGTLYR